MDTIATWIKLSLSDLKASMILYEQKQFRTSYFLFQQAAEKANKAFALKFDLVKEEELKGTGHNQFKILRNYLVNKEKAYKKLSENDRNNPSKFAVKQGGLVNSLKAIDKLHNQDLINISSSDINALYKDIIEYQNLFTLRSPELQEYFENSKESRNVNHMILFLFNWTQEFYFILFALFACAVITTQHSTLPRYPEKGINPLLIYTRKLPVIKKQPLFMSLLKDAIQRLNKFSSEPEFSQKKRTKNKGN